MKLEQNFFTLLGQVQQFTVNRAALKKQFRHLQREYHPDRYIAKTPQEQRLAVQFSAHLNTAFAVLDNPVKRATHLLELSGVEIDHQNSTIKDPSFLMQQMEIRETLDDARAASDLPALEVLLNQVSDQFHACQQGFSAQMESTQLSSPSDEKDLRDTVGKMQFYEKLCDELTSIIRSLS